MITIPSQTLQRYHSDYETIKIDVGVLIDPPSYFVRIDSKHLKYLVIRVFYLYYIS